MSIHTHPSSRSTNIPLILISILLPPFPVFIRTGCSPHLILNLILTVIAWIPGVIHAWWVVYRYRGQRFGEKSFGEAKRMSDRTEYFRVYDEKAPAVGAGAEFNGGYGNEHGAFGEKHGVVNGNEQNSVVSGNLTMEGVRGVDVMGRGNMDGYYGPTDAGNEAMSAAPAYESQEVQKETPTLPLRNEKQ